jgi:hypothetical protein
MMLSQASAQAKATNNDAVYSPYFLTQTLTIRHLKEK